MLQDALDDGVLASFEVEGGNESTAAIMASVYRAGSRWKVRALGTNAPCEQVRA